MGNSATRDRFRSLSPAAEARPAPVDHRPPRSVSETPGTSKFGIEDSVIPKKKISKKSHHDILADLTKSLEFSARFLSTTPEVAAPMYETLELDPQDRTKLKSRPVSEHQMSFSENMDQ